MEKKLILLNFTIFSKSSVTPNKFILHSMLLCFKTFQHLAYECISLIKRKRNYAFGSVYPLNSLGISQIMIQFSLRLDQCFSVLK